MLKQEALLKKALRERGYSPRDLVIEVDHMLGFSKINGTRVPLIYPDSFFRRAKQFHGHPKKLDFHFDGLINASGGREEILAPFRGLPRSNVVSSSLGRVDLFKGHFNWKYFRDLSRSRFGLCPHHLDWPGDFFWTYRFVECLMVGTIPVIFHKTPLSESFTSGFFYLWEDSQLLRSLSDERLKDWADQNYRLATERFLLPDWSF